MSSEGPAAVSASGGEHNRRCAEIKLSAGLKHELRTPLNHIIGYSEMLIEQAEDDGPEVFVPDLDRIHSAGKRLLGIIDKFCDPVARSQIDEPAMLREVRSCLNQVMGYAQMLEEQAKELGQNSFISDLQKLHGAGRHLLTLVLENVVSSPLDSVPAECEVISFQRGRALAEKLPSEQAESITTESASLLIVDDNELNRDMLTRRLERLGYKVSCAENGSEAIEKMRTASYDLVLLDIIMPVMNGFEVLKKLKAAPLLREVPVIVLSASDELNHAVSCIQMGAEDYLTKPFNPVLLQARIGSCLERKRLRDQEISYLRQIEEEKQRSDELLHVILPKDVAAELKATKGVKPRRFENVAILFCDVVGFTAYSEQRRPEEIVSHLQTLVEAFEQLCAQHSLEKLKTIGDSFMATAGLLTPLENPALQCVRCGLEMAALAQKLPTHWQVRVGINVGPVIAGVVGHGKYQYDIWGDAVNTAARMQKAAVAGSICVNKNTWNLIAGHCCGRSLGLVQVKGKGEQELFQVDCLSN